MEMEAHVILVLLDGTIRSLNWEDGCEEWRISSSVFGANTHKESADTSASNNNSPLRHSGVLLKSHDIPSFDQSGPSSHHCSHTEGDDPLCWFRTYGHSVDNRHSSPFIKSLIAGFGAAEGAVYQRVNHSFIERIHMDVLKKHAVHNGLVIMSDTASRYAEVDGRSGTILFTSAQEASESPHRSVSRTRKLIENEKINDNNDIFQRQEEEKVNEGEQREPLIISIYTETTSHRVFVRSSGVKASFGARHISLGCVMSTKPLSNSLCLLEPFPTLLSHSTTPYSDDNSIIENGSKISNGDINTAISFTDNVNIDKMEFPRGLNPHTLTSESVDDSCTVLTPTTASQAKGHIPHITITVLVTGEVCLKRHSHEDVSMSENDIDGEWETDMGCEVVRAYFVGELTKHGTPCHTFFYEIPVKVADEVIHLEDIYSGFRSSGVENNRVKFYFNEEKNFFFQEPNYSFRRASGYSTSLQAQTYEMTPVKKAFVGKLNYTSTGLAMTAVPGLPLPYYSAIQSIMQKDKTATALVPFHSYPAAFPSGISNNLSHPQNISFLCEHFRLLGRLGSGGGGMVYLVESPLMMEKFAIKMIPVVKSSCRREVLEASNQVKLFHPNLVRFYYAWLEVWPNESLRKVLMECEDFMDQSITDDQPYSFTSEQTSLSVSTTLSDSEHDNESEVGSRAIENAKSEMLSATYKKTKSVVSTNSTNELNDKMTAFRGTINEQGTSDLMLLVILMEYCPQTLTKWLSVRTTISWRQSIDLSLQLFRTLDFLHKKNIVHFDIKPANLFVSINGDELKVGDMGISKRFTQRTYDGDSNNDRSKSPSSSYGQDDTTCKGTPLYASPEQMIGGKCGTESDMFSAGLVMLELFMNPYTVSERLEILYEARENLKIQSNLFDNNNTHGSRLENLILKCLLHQPQQRPTAADVCQELSMLLKVF